MFRPVQNLSGLHQMILSLRQELQSFLIMVVNVRADAALKNVQPITHRPQ